MADAVQEKELDLFFMQQEDAWERDSRLMAELHNLRAFVGLGGAKDFQFMEPDDFNAWLREPEDPTSAERKRAEEDAIIAEREAELKAKKDGKQEQH